MAAKLNDRTILKIIRAEDRGLSSEQVCLDVGISMRLYSENRENVAIVRFQRQKRKEESKIKAPLNLDQYYLYGTYGLKYCEISALLGIKKEKLYDAMKKHPEIKLAIEKGKEEADCKVIKSLLKRATGFKIKKRKMVTFQGEVTDDYEEDEIFPPDTKAALAWLQNRKGWHLFDTPKVKEEKGEILKAIDKMLEIPAEEKDEDGNRETD